MLQIVGNVDDNLMRICDELNIRVTKEEQRLNIRPLLRILCRRFFGNNSGSLLYIFNE